MSRHHVCSHFPTVPQPWYRVSHRRRDEPPFEAKRVARSCCSSRDAAPAACHRRATRNYPDVQLHAHQAADRSHCCVHLIKARSSRVSFGAGSPRLQAYPALAASFPRFLNRPEQPPMLHALWPDTLGTRHNPTMLPPVIQAIGRSSSVSHGNPLFLKPTFYF